MNSRVRRNVLISEPHALENPAPFLPYVWAILKSHWERHGDVDAYHWLPPIFLNRDPDTLLEPYRNTPIDVLGLSCYTWNFRLQCALAERVKRANPTCLVVVGGPEPDYKDPEFFIKYPYIDAIAVKDGEITFSRILSSLLDGKRDFSDIGGLYLPAAANGRLVGGRLPSVNQGSHVCTGPAEVLKEFDYSPYLEQRAFYDALIGQYGRGFFSATWETNRGCPYSCSFCDWGSATMSKLRRFSMERVAAEVDYLAVMGASFVMLADANLGILERDLEIADLLVAARAKHGFPRMLYYSAAKNNPDRSVQIARKFSLAQLCSTHTLAVQHTRPEVLEATARANISPDKQIGVARALMESDIPIDVQLILGIPGDSYDLWKGALGDLMEWGIHEAYDTYFYSLLPNAPAADPDFLRKWEVETMDRIILADTAQPWKAGDLDMVRMTTSRIVMKSKTFSSADWVRMFTYVSHVKALHNGSLTRLIAIYLRLTHGVSYRAFYEDLIEHFAATVEPLGKWHDAIAGCYTTMLHNPDAMDRMPVAELPNYPYALDPSRWLFVHACFHVDAFFSALKKYFLDRYPDADNLASLIDFQKESIILPEYDRRAGKRFRSDFDWLTYFAATKGRTGNDSMPEPDATPGAVVEVSDQTCGERGYLVQPLAWEGKSGEDRRIEWIKRTVLHRSSARKQNFQQMHLKLRGESTPRPETARAQLWIPMSTAPVFKDPALQRHFDEFGYVTFPLLSAEVVDTIRESYSKLNLEDKFGIGYKVSLYSADLETRRRAREFLIDTAFPALDSYLVDRYVYMATYLVKEPDGRSIPSHQDWSHCDETRHDSIMCWIPLCDVDQHNGGLGFINGSHRYFDYLRVFPYSVAKTPVDVHGMRLLPYLNIVNMRAGDVVVFNNRVIHGSLPNSGTARRTALSFALHPKGEPLLGYYLKPKTGGSVVLRYQATPEFYLEYPNPKMVELYARGTEIQGYECEEVPYSLPTVEWEELAAKLHATGNRMDPGKVPPAKELTGQAAAARTPSTGAGRSA